MSTIEEIRGDLGHLTRGAITRRRGELPPSKRTLDASSTLSKAIDELEQLRTTAEQLRTENVHLFEELGNSLRAESVTINAARAKVERLKEVISVKDEALAQLIIFAEENWRHIPVRMNSFTGAVENARGALAVKP